MLIKRVSDTKIFRLEKDTEDLARFLNGYGMTWSHRNKKDTPYDYRSFYNRESFDLVKSIYTGDVNQFDYKSEQESLERFLAN
jgi:hypothetical protein